MNIPSHEGRVVRAFQRGSKGVVVLNGRIKERKKTGVGKKVFKKGEEKMRGRGRRERRIYR